MRTRIGASSRTFWLGTFWRRKHSSSLNAFFGHLNIEPKAGAKCVLDAMMGYRHGQDSPKQSKASKEQFPHFGYTLESISTIITAMFLTLLL